MTRRIEFCDGCHCEVKMCVCEPDTLAKSDDFVSLPRAEVEALMEAASDAASELASIRHHIAAAIVKKALATLQERMK